MPYDSDGTWREPYIETEEERQARAEYEAEMIDAHFDAMSGLDPEDCRDMTALDQLGAQQHAARLGVQLPQIAQSVSDALKAVSDQPEPQRVGGHQEDGRLRESEETVRKLKAELEKEKSRNKERGIGR